MLDFLDERKSLTDKTLLNFNLSIKYTNTDKE